MEIDRSRRHLIRYLRKMIPAEKAKRPDRAPRPSHRLTTYRVWCYSFGQLGGYEGLEGEEVEGTGGAEDESPFFHEKKTAVIIRKRPVRHPTEQKNILRRTRRKNDILNSPHPTKRGGAGSLPSWSSFSARCASTWAGHRPTRFPAGLSRGS